MEDKQKICDLLLATLQATYNGHEIVSLKYDADNERVIITYASGGHRSVNVAMDSGTAMIRDVMKFI